MPAGAEPPSAGRTPCGLIWDELPGLADANLDFAEFDGLLQRFENLEPRSGRPLELRFFGGLSIEEAAAVLEISVATAKRDWTIARAWLQRELQRA